MKKLFAILLTLLLTSMVFAYDGILWNAKKLNVNKTQWFDIIYPDECSAAADILAKKADQIFEEIKTQYNYAPYYRMPVVITNEVENFNAYWTSAPYNRIVLYNTSAIEDLEVFSETFLSTFRHELTHAVSYNLKGPFLRFFSKVFGDFVTFSGVTITRGWAEGAAVSSESSKGEGRANSEYALHVIKQAKIEDKFPFYADVQGSSDMRPSGSFYSFNGPFDLWLQQKYGMDKYAALWYKCVNLHTISIGWSFHTIYGITLNEAWEQFRQDINVPAGLNANPVEAGISKDLFDESKTSYSSKNNSGHVYSNLTAGNNGIVYYNDVDSGVYFVNKEKLNSNSKIKPKKLFTDKYVSQLSLSSDGKYLSVISYNSLAATVQSKAYVYNMATGKKVHYKDSGVYEATVVSKQSENYLVKKVFNNCVSSIEIQKLSDSMTVSQSEQPVIIPFVFDTLIDSITDLGDGTFAVIVKEGLNNSICIYDLAGNQISKAEAPVNGMVIRHLSFDGSDLYFSYTVPGSMPRVGKYILSVSQYELSDKDISGGIFYPVNINNKLIYIGCFYRESRLLALNADAEFALPVLPVKEENSVSEEVIAEITVEDTTETSDYQYSTEDYKPFKYYTKGMIFPFSQISSYTFDGMQGAYSIPIGLSYTTSNPWAGDNLALEAGWGYRTNSFGIKATYESGTNTSIFKWGTSAATEFDFSGWKQAYGSVNVSSAFPLGKISGLRFGEQVFGFYGRGNRNIPEDYNSYIGGAMDPEKTNRVYAENTISTTYSCINYLGDSRYEKLGLILAAKFSYVYNQAFGEKEEILKNGGDIGLAASFYIPRLLPYECKQGLVYNFPVKINANLFSVTVDESSVLSMFGVSSKLDNLPSYNAASINAETVLFACGIQKAVPVITAIFVNDIRLSAGFYGGFLYNLEDYYMNFKLFHMNHFIDEVKTGVLSFDGYPYIKVNMSLTPNFGGFANTASTNDLFLKLGFATIQTSMKPILEFGIDTSF